MHQLTNIDLGRRSEIELHGDTGHRTNRTGQPGAAGRVDQCGNGQARLAPETRCPSTVSLKPSPVLIVSR